MNKWLQILGLEQTTVHISDHTTLRTRRLERMRNRRFTAEDLVKEFGCSKASAAKMVTMWHQENKTKLVGQIRVNPKFKPRNVYEVI